MRASRTLPTPLRLAQDRASAKPITWAELAAPRASRGADSRPHRFHATWISLRQAHAARVREGDLDHLVFYVLQSTGFTSLPSIEPALSAKALVEGLGEGARVVSAHRRGGVLARIRRRPSRIAKLLVALGAPTRDARILYFGELVRTTFPQAARPRTGLAREYLRVMRFVYQKEFVAQRSSRPADAVADLYRSRGLSTDTAVEAGYVASIGLAIVKWLDPEQPSAASSSSVQVWTLAPRTALLEVGPPQSYQPWAMMDALVAQRPVPTGGARSRGRRHQSSSRRAPPACARGSTDPQSGE